MKPAYRLFDRDEVTHEAILAPQGRRTRRAPRQPGRSLLPEATTELDFTGHPAPEGLGRIGGARDDQGPRGLLPHTGLAVQLLPGPGPDVGVGRLVGRAHQVVRARTTPPSQVQHGRRPSPKVRLGQEDREGRRWSAVTDHRAPPPPGTTGVVAQDREGDLDEALIQGSNKGVSFVIRADRERVTADGDAHRSDAVAAAPVLGHGAVELPRRAERPRRTAPLTSRAPRPGSRAP